MSSAKHILVNELSINACASLQAHSLSNSGTNGSNRLLGRRQLLSDGSESDAISGNIAKHHHAALLAELMEEAEITLCPACAARDGRRAAALVGRDGYQNLSIDQVLQCGLCDVHGFLVTPKNADSKGGGEARQRLSKHSLIEFGWPLALPGHQAEAVQLMTRVGDSKEAGQMLMKMPVRSGVYAINVRYKSVGIGVDTDKWKVVVTNEEQRLQRHKAVLAALRDQFLSPSGALTATMLPHLTGLMGAIVIREGAGRAAIYSALEGDFVEQLMALSGVMAQVIPFNSISNFAAIMNMLIDTSYPRLPGHSNANYSKKSGYERE